jgi:hypothetical protein
MGHGTAGKGGGRAGRGAWLSPAAASFAIALLSLGAAAYALTLPWAGGRALAVFGFARGPRVALLVALAAAVAAGAAEAVAARRATRGTMAATHVALGLAMAGLAVSALVRINGAGARILGLRAASARPAAGLWLWLAAGVLLLVMGLVELAILLRARPARP